MIRDFKKLEKILTERAREFGCGCKKVFVAVSGGIDSSLVAAILCKAFGPENVVGLYRDIKSNEKHKNDLELLRDKLGFRLISLNLNDLYDDLVQRIKKQFEEKGLDWNDEGGALAEESGFTCAYASLKSRFITPLAGFISKAIDRGRGRVFGTGNGEEDGYLRYFDKYGDGAVDNNILAGLNKAEVKQLARHMGIPECIITKLPSADLEGNGDAQNDEFQLTKWANDLGYRIKVSYGSADGSKEGNIAWAWKEDLKSGIISGRNSGMNYEELLGLYGDQKKAETVLFLRDVEKLTRHKIEPIPAVKREELLRLGVID